MAHTCKVASETEAEGAQAQTQPRQHPEFQAGVDSVDTPCPKGSLGWRTTS